ncbi:MAG: hypothetical protein JWM76_4542 [Pseudonocardiales bacterium]|nr:hypothetical protein [Pseudonocardiales bacterium]
MGLSPHHFANGATVVGAVIGSGLLLAGALIKFKYIPITKDDPTETKRQGGLINPAELVEDWKTPTTWATSKQRTAWINRRGRSYLSAMGGGVWVFTGVYLLTAYLDSDSGSSRNQLWTIAIALQAMGLLAVAYAVVPYVAAKNAYRTMTQATASALVSIALKDACDAEHPLALPKLFELNRRQLDEYQAVSRRQQALAFQGAQTASIVAFVVLVAGVIVAITTGTSTEKYITGGLTAVGALLSAFLAQTFFKSVDNANQQQNLYYRDPQQTGRLLGVERIIENLSQLAPVVVEDSDSASNEPPALGTPPLTPPLGTPTPAQGTPTTAAAPSPPHVDPALITQIVQAVLAWNLPNPPGFAPPATTPDTVTLTKAK